MPRVLGIGDNTVDLYVDQGIQFPGGNAVNVAVLTARLGARSSYLGCLGHDVAGRLILDSLKAEGVDVSHCRVLDAPTAWSVIRHRGNDRVFASSSRGCRGRYELGPKDLGFVAAHDLAHTSIYSELEGELPRLAAAAPVLSFDFSEEWDDAYLGRTLPHVDIAFLSWPGHDDLDCAGLLRELARRGPSLVVITRGLEGAMACDGGAVYRQPIVEAEVVDTLGAGDAFIAAFLMARLRGEPVPACLQAGAAYAARACASRGAYGHGIPITPGQPGTERPTAASQP